jgi:hypothetical protein
MAILGQEGGSRAAGAAEKRLSPCKWHDPMVQIPLELVNVRGRSESEVVIVA